MSKPDPEFIEPKLEPEELPKGRYERAAEHPPRLKVQPAPPPPPRPWPLVRFFVNLLVIHLIAAVVFADALAIVWGVRWLMAH